MPIIKWLRDRYLGHPFRLFTATVKGVFITHLVNEYAYSYAHTWGASMLPTFHVTGDTVLISRFYRGGRGIVPGDIISFDSVVEPGEKVIKRVVGLEGDYVLRDTPGENNIMVQVPRGHVWVVGDNLPFSRDSRHFGPLPKALIKGKVIAKILPFRERRWILNDLQPVQSD